MEIQIMNPIEIERQKINDVDEALIKLLDLRFKLVRTIGKIKKQNNIPIFQATREQEVLTRVSNLSVNSKFTSGIFKEIMKQSKDFQEEIT